MKKFINLGLLFLVSTAFGAENRINRLERMNILGMAIVMVEEIAINEGIAPVEEIAPQVNNRQNFQVRRIVENFNFFECPVEQSFIIIGKNGI